MGKIPHYLVSDFLVALIKAQSHEHKQPFFRKQTALYFVSCSSDFCSFNEYSFSSPFILKKAVDKNLLPLIKF